MGRVVSGWEQERIADYGACGVGQERITYSKPTGTQMLV